MYTLFFQAHKHGYPIMRPLWIHYSSDQDCLTIDNQFLLGEDILVKPITEQSSRSALVYFPGTESWYDMELGKAYDPQGGRKLEVESPLSKTPAFQRGGSIISLMPRPRRSSAAMINDPYTLQIALDSNGNTIKSVYKPFKFVPFFFYTWDFFIYLLWLLNGINSISFLFMALLRERKIKTKTHIFETLYYSFTFLSCFFFFLNFFKQAVLKAICIWMTEQLSTFRKVNIAIVISYLTMVCFDQKPLMLRSSTFLQTPLKGWFCWVLKPRHPFGSSKRLQVVYKPQKDNWTLNLTKNSTY